MARPVLFRLAALALVLAAQATLGACQGQGLSSKGQLPGPQAEPSAAAGGATAPSPGTETEPEGFVTVKHGRFELNGQPWFITGTNIYYLYQRAADVKGVRNETETSFQEAARLGLNVIRTAAFGDGADVWNAIQVAPGQLNETILRTGLDYTVSLACRYNIRLLLTLTNIWPTGGNLGSMYLYTTAWGGHRQLSDFYTKPAPQALYKQYVQDILTRQNSITGRLYSEDPCILGWDLVNEPLNPGDDTGDVMQAWLEDVAPFVKSLAPRQLLTTGMQGYFGASTPHLLRFNPPHRVLLRPPLLVPPLGMPNGPDPSVFGPFTGSYIPFNAVCEGTDFVRNHLTPGIDFVTVHLWPDGSYVCSDECKIEGTRAMLRAQLDAATQIGKPIVVEEFGKVRPVAGRNAFYSMVFQELLEAREAGKNVGGSLFWMLAANSYPDYDGNSIYTDAQAYLQLPSLPYTQRAPEDIAQQQAVYAMWSNYYEMLDCLGHQAGNGTAAWSEGWQDTLHLITDQVQAMAA